MANSSKSISLGSEDGEQIPQNEENAIQEVTKLIESQVRSVSSKEGLAFRDAHRKHHGCVKATFNVLPGLPDKFSKSFFSQAKSYPAVIRFSNGSGHVQDDHEGDGRGMALKVLGVEGPRNLSGQDDEVTSQDFLMINHPVFFVRNAMDYVDFQKAVQSGNILWWLLNPSRLFHESLIVKEIQGKKMLNPLNASYFSMTASKFENSQMKFRATPCQGAQYKSFSESKDRLRENLEATLTNMDACFRFEIQLRTKPNEMSVEDPTIEWEETASPFFPVAEVRIPMQKAEQGIACESLSFNPWNGRSDLRPLGGISRARKAVYGTISRLRHKINGQPRVEPKAE